MSYFDTDILHERIAMLQQELLEKHAKVHEALRLRDLANEHIAELEYALQNIVNSDVLSRVVDRNYYIDAVSALYGGAE